MSSSIIIPTHNSGKLLVETLSSVHRELGADDEVIIVDDGSSDGTKGLISNFLKDKRYRYYYQSCSGGPSSPRNRGIEAAKGDYIFLFDSDDVMLPGKIESTVLAFQEFPDAALVFTNFSTVEESGDVLKERFLDEYELIRKLRSSLRLNHILIEGAMAYTYLAKENFIGTSGVAIRACVFSEVGGFDETLKNGDDKDMWFRITRKYPIAYVDQVLHHYRIHQNSISRGGALKRADARIKVLKKQLEDPVSKEFARDIRRQIALNYYAKGYELFSTGDMTGARDCLARALRYCFQPRFISLYAKTLLGKRGVEALRSLKHRLGS